MTDLRTYDEFLKQLTCDIANCPERRDQIIAEAMRCSGCPYLQRMVIQHFEGLIGQSTPSNNTIFKSSHPLTTTSEK